jgi:N-acetylneuraminate lyase
LDNLSGIFPATVSTFDMDGKFDPSSMRRIVRHQIDAGVHGLYVCGGTGEGLLMNSKERQDLLETVLDETRGAVTVIAHVGAFQIPESIALAQHASGIGVDAISALPPSYFYKPDEISQINYYKSIAQVSEVPLLIYNIPQRTGIAMTESLYDELIQIDNVIGMKDSSGDIYTLGHLASKWKESVIFEGEDSLLLPSLIAGAIGGIGASYNLMPELYVQLWEAYQGNNIDKAAEIQARVNDIIRALLISPDLIGGIKQVLGWMDLECGPPRSPNRTLRSEEAAKLRKAFDNIGFFDNT